MNDLIISHFEQGSPEWLAARKGVVTASNFSKIVTPKGLKPSAQADDYMDALIGECYNPNAPDSFGGNIYTRYGTEMEPEARRAFAHATKLDVREVGFCRRGAIGCSPDGLIFAGDNPIAGLEIKCLQPAGRVKAALSAEIPGNHLMQIHGSLHVTGLDLWYYWTYDPIMGGDLAEVRRDRTTEALGREVDAFAERYRQRVPDVERALEGPMHRQRLFRAFEEMHGAPNLSQTVALLHDEEGLL